MTSKLKIAANRRNAKLSTGPSEAAKARTRFNGLKHGLRAQTAVLPGEDRQEYFALEERWGNRLTPRDEIEADLVADIVNACWFQRRIERVQFENLKTQIEQAGDSEDLAVAMDIRRLFWDPLGHFCLYGISSAACGGPRTSSPEQPDGPLEPRVVLTRLESSPKGCQALAECWRELRVRLENGHEWQSPERFKSLRLLAKQPIEAAVDDRARLVFEACFALHPRGKQHPYEDLKSDMRTPELEEYAQRMKAREPRLFPAHDTATAKRCLLELVDRSLERLEAKLEVFGVVKDERAASRSALLAFDQSPLGEQLRRYEAASERRKHRCLDAFWKLRAKMEASAEEQADELEAENASDLSANSEAAREAPDPEKKNLTSEANGGLDATEVAILAELVTRDEEARRYLDVLTGKRPPVIGPPGSGVAGGAMSRAALEAAILPSRPLMRPIS